MAMRSEAADERGMRSGELARRAGVSPDSLRHYERIGVLPTAERTAAGYRVYSPGAFERVRLVRRALGVGFTLGELARIFHVRDTGGVPCRQARALGEAKLAEVERTIREMTALRTELRQILRAWDRRLRKTPRGERAGLLDLLSERPLPASTSPLLRRRKERFR